MVEPTLSIIVPVLDEASTIGSALAALQGYRAAGTEIVVVDGGSNDDTRAIAAPLCDILLPAPRGRAAQMNAGATASRGELLLFLHADTRLPERADERVRGALRSHLWGRFDVHIDGRSRVLPLVAAMMNLRSRLTGIATGDQAIFARREAFDQAGGFPDIALMEDVALCSRLRRLGRARALRARVITSGRRWDTHGALNTIFLMWRLRFAYFLGAAPDVLAQRYGYGRRDGGDGGEVSSRSDE